MAHRPIRAQPGKGEIDHAQQRHRRRLAGQGIEAVGRNPFQGLGKLIHHGALLSPDLLACRGLQALDIIEQGDMMSARIAILQHQGSHHFAEFVAWLEPPGVHLGEPVHEQFRVAIERLEQDRVLARKVVVQAGLRQAAGLGQLRHRGAAITEFCDRFGGSQQDAIALVRMVCGTGSAHPQRSSKLTTTRSLTGWAWQVSTKPCAISCGSSVKLRSILTSPSSTRARQVQHTPALQA